MTTLLTEKQNKRNQEGKKTGITYVWLVKKKVNPMQLIPFGIWILVCFSWAEAVQKGPETFCLIEARWKPPGSIQISNPAHFTL